MPRTLHCRFHWLLLPLLLLAVPTAAQQPDLRALDRTIAQAREAWGVPGLAVAIVKDGDVVLAKGYGVRSITEGGAVDENTLFAIASNSKAFTTASLAMLVDDGTLSWDDRVQDWLPWFEMYDPWVSHEMRIQDLLCHRSGLGTYSGDLLWYGTTYDAEEVVRRLRYLEPAGEFRASYGYSNLMFITAGQVLEAAAGEPWADFVQEHILTPLGMDRTVTSTTALAATDNVAIPHGTDAEGVLRPYDWYNWDAMAAAGGIISSVADMTKWIRLQLGHGTVDGRTYFSSSASTTMWTVHNPFRVSSGYRETYPSTHFRGYGLGWSLNDYKGRMVASHGGGYDGMFSRVVLVPDEKLGMVILTNSMTGISTALANTILDAYLGGDHRDWSATMLESFRASEERELQRRHDAITSTLHGGPSLPLDAYTGTYGGPMYGDGTITLEDGHLVLRLLPAPDLVADLRHLHHDTFVLTWRKPLAWFDNGTVTFHLDRTGRVDDLDIFVPNQDLWFDELAMHRKADGS